MTLPRPSLLIVLQNPLHQFTDKSADWLMVNPPKLTGLNRVVGKSGVVYTETKINWLIPNTNLFNTKIVQITENMFSKKENFSPVLEQF